ncbi:MAG: hypothetical protein ACRC2M_10360 [Planktothrix sp.]
MPVATISRWATSQEWQSVSDAFKLVDVYSQDVLDQVWQDKHLQELQEWQDKQKTIANFQAGITIQLCQLTADLIKEIKESEVEGFEKLKQVGNFNSLSSAVDRFHNRSTEAMTQYLSIDKILEAIANPEPKQLELDFGG